MKVLAIILGALLVDVAVRGTFEDSALGNGDGKGLWPLLKADFEPGAKGNFLAWFSAILIIGMIGYVPQLKPITNSMLVLVILVLLLAEGNPSKTGGGFFAMLKQAAITGPPAPAATASAPGVAALVP